MEELFEQAKKYLLIIIFLYFTLPITFIFLREDIKSGLTFGYLYALAPIVIFSVSLMYSVRHGFNWRFPAFVGIVFVPAAIIYFEIQNTVFAMTYCIFSFVGSGFGTFIKRLL